VTKCGLAEDRARRSVISASDTPNRSRFQNRMSHDPSSYRLIFHDGFEANGPKPFMLRPDDLMHHTAESRLQRCIHSHWMRTCF